MLAFPGQVSVLVGFCKGNTQKDNHQGPQKKRRTSSTPPTPYLPPPTHPPPTGLPSVGQKPKKVLRASPLTPSALRWLSSRHHGTMGTQPLVFPGSTTTPCWENICVCVLSAPTPGFPDKNFPVFMWACSCEGHQSKRSRETKTKRPLKQTYVLGFSFGLRSPIVARDWYEVKRATINCNVVRAERLLKVDMGV